MSRYTSQICVDASTQELMAELFRDEQVLAEASEKVLQYEKERDRLQVRIEALKKALELLA